MAVKLIKACKDLNISMATLVSFCEKNGCPVPSDPNYRLSDSTYLLLAQEYKPEMVPITSSTPQQIKPESNNNGTENKEQLFESLSNRINDLKQKLMSSRIVTPAQKKDIEKLHHEVIFHTGFSGKQQLQINRSILNLQDIVNDIESSERRRPIGELIEELKTLTIENGFIEKRKLIRTKIKTDKRLLKEDVKILLHRLNQTIPYVPKVEHSSGHDNDSGQPSLESSSMAEELIIPWSQIKFGNNVMRIENADGKFLLAPRENCRRSYNQIKEYLADKLPLIVVIKNNSGVWTFKEPIVFKKALLMIRNKESEDLIQEERYKRALRSFASMEDYLQYKQNQELVLRRLKDKKQDFLNYLIKYQLDDYKLIPAIEMISHESSESVGEEDVFIFTIPCKSYRFGMDCVNIVYENINAARASIVCTVETKNYIQALQSLFNFMNDESQKNKRSRLHQTLRLSSAVRNLHVVNHTDMHSWAMSVQN